MRTELLGDIERLPGGDLILAGLSDRSQGRVTAASCLVAIGEPHLRRAGLLNDDRRAGSFEAAEIVLYRLLRSEPGDPYSRYNSLLRRLVSFERALSRLTRDKRGE
jgi:hypothetical protein